MAPSFDETVDAPAPPNSNGSGLRKRQMNGRSVQISDGLNGDSDIVQEPVNLTEDDSDKNHTNGLTAGITNGHVAPALPSPEPTRGAPFRRGTHRIRSMGVHEGEALGPGRASARVESWSTDSNTPRYPRLSKPLELMRSSYDCIVIGSGYGGGVAASRMSRTNQTVCILERGKEKWPGEYPSGTVDALEEVHYSGEFAPGWFPKKLVDGGDPTGLYHTIFGNGQNAVVANGEFLLLAPCSRSFANMVGSRTWWDKLDKCKCVSGGRQENSGARGLAGRDQGRS
jgi:hypothetical protein